MTAPGAADGYRAFHAPRFRYLADLVERYLPASGGRVLDIGLSPFTELLRSRVSVPIDTLGLEPPSPERVNHFPFDLNSLADARAPRPALPSYNVIVFAEVLEHLHVAPETPLVFLHQHLADRGVLILQTPNAASLGKRLKLLVGQNPYEMIRADRSNPGHFREYTLAELQKLAAETSFSLVDVDRRFYFDARFAHHREDGGAGVPRPIAGAVKNVVYSALPPPLREGLTLVLRKEATCLS